MKKVSIIIPVFNEAEGITAFLDSLEACTRANCEVILVDGKSTDATIARARESLTPCTCITAERGRGQQLSAGVAASDGEVLWFLHADTGNSAQALDALRKTLASEAQWGFFNVRIDGSAFMFRIVERAMNLRSRMTGICTGDQGVFVSRPALEHAGGIPRQPLMEDIELARRLKRIGRPGHPSGHLTTSARYWETHGIFRTISRMWWLRLRYFLNADPTALARSYYRRHKQTDSPADDKPE